MVRVFRGPLLAAALVVPAASPAVFAGSTSTGSMPASNYYGFQPPARGGSYTDPAFGSAITRLSSALSSPNADGGGSLTWILNEYSTPALWNSSNSYFLLQHNGYIALYGGSGAYIRDIPFDMNSSTEPRWSRTDPNVVYYKRGNALKAYNVSTGGISTVRAFTEYGGISGKGESDICFDGDHIVLVGDNRDVFVYTISSNQKGPVFNTSGNGFDSVYISADDTVTITWLAGGTGRYRGIELFDRNMNFLRQVARSGGHMDMARDTDGSAVLVWTNSNDPIPVCDNGIVKIRLSDGHQTCLVSLDWNLAVHIAGSDNGWAVVSTYAPSDPNPGGFWPPYTNEVFRVRLDGGVVERLAHHRSRPFNGYNYMAKATLSRDGSRVIYASNYGLQAILGYPSEYSDAYLINLGGALPTSPPPTATPVPTATPAPTPTPTPGSRVEESSPSVVYAGTWQTQSKPVHTAGATALTRTAGAESTVWFTGTGVVWRGVRDPWSGQAQVYVDGVLRGTVDMYAANETAQDNLFTATGLVAGTHHLTVRALGTQNAASTDSWVWVDAFDVAGGTGTTPGATPTPGPTTPTPAPTPQPTAGATPTPGSGRIEQTSGSVSYTGTWQTQSKPVHSAGSTALTREAGAEATVSFVGTGIVWRGVRDPWSGMAQVYVDGVLQGNVDLYAAGETAQDALYTVTGLAAGSHTFKVRALGTRNPSSTDTWIWVDAFDVTSGGGSPATPTPTPVPPAGDIAQITSPAPGSRLTSSTVTFAWSPGSGINEYWLSVGTVQGGSQLWGGSVGRSLSQTVSGIPNDGRTVYVRIESLKGGTWRSHSASYSTGNGPTPAPTATATPVPTPAPTATPVPTLPPSSDIAQITLPVPGSRLTSSTAAFAWSSGTGVAEYWLSVGTTPGGSQFWGGSVGRALSQTVSGLPTDGRAVYVRIESLKGGTWRANNATYSTGSGPTPAPTATATPTPTPAATPTPASTPAPLSDIAVVTGPVPGSRLTSPAATFTWSPGSGVSEYWLSVGTSPGGSQLWGGPKGLGTSQTVSGLPTDGRTVYVRIQSLKSGTWQSSSASYATGP